MFEQNLFEQNMFEQNMFDQNIIEQNIFEQNMFEQNMFEQNMFERNMFEQNMFEQNMFEQNTFEQNMFEQNMFEQNMFEQNMLEQNMFEQNMFEQNMFEQNMFEQNMFEQNMFEQNMYSLREPMQDSEITVEVRHNLKPEIKHELLHIDTPNLATLRKECHRHEDFFRSTRTKPIQRPNTSKRFVNAILQEDDSEDQSEEEQDVEDEICVVRTPEKIKCWNCDESGHGYQNCLKTRRIFCYGCGTPEVYKPNCAKCKSASENSQQGIRYANKTSVRR
ncbi:GD23229 [Drosophila simulans]|uniref:GD23229 n=1 Tax=Drosophila simulans TaxID=7240 RepID=B4Q9K1_DROSI|nr:GD23229 [Drosophila simulans]